jgi:membrane protein implicated in regulation of membrane protease activity
VLALATTTTAAWLCELLGGAPTVYGTLFVLSSTATALWVRPADLICAPIAAPISFAGGLLTASGPAATVTELAMRAPWVFAGTLAAVLIALLRKGLEVLRRRLRRRHRPARG